MCLLNTGRDVWKHHCKNQEAGLLGGLWDGPRIGM